MIGFENISVTSPYRIKVVKDLQMEWNPNEHARLFICGLLDEQEQVNAVLKASTDDEVQVYDGETKIFSGLIANVQTKHHNGIYSIELEVISGTSRLDVQKRRRSFQNKNMTYGELVKSVLKAYAGYDVIQLVGENKPIGAPIIQYDETDWEFLKRMASHLQSVVFSDIYEAKPRMYIGVPNRNSIQLPDDLPYTASKDLLAYQEARSGAASVHHTDFFTYEVQSGTRYAIGDEALFRDKPMVISEMKAAMNQGQLIYKYRLSRRDGIRQNWIHNPKLVGVSMNGKVLDVKGQQVKLHLEIDQEQPPASAYWFPFAPPTGSAMYSMPQKGTNASLYFPDDAGSKAKVIGCVRTNGEDCGKTGDPNNRYFGTEHGSELEITPTAINVVSGSKEPLMISFDDAAGVILTSHRKLTMNAGEDISLYTPKRVVFRTPNMILAKKLSKLSGFTVESEYHLLGSQVKLDGADRTSYEKYNDEIQTYTPKEETEEKKFSWGKLFGNVMAGLVVVAAVTLFAAACVVTLGAAGVVVGVSAGAVAAGAAIAGTAAVASMAVSDIIRGEVSDVEDYMLTAFRETVIGAVSGAIFGPFGTMATIGGKMAFGATTNTFESIMRQNMEGNGFSFGTLFLDAGIGGITGGLFDSRVLKGIGKVGIKAFQKANGLVQKAIGSSTAWLKQGVKSVEEGFKERLKDLAAAGSQFARMFKGRELSPVNGASINHLEKWKPEKIPPKTEVQINYEKVMKELEEEAEKRAARGADPTGTGEGRRIPGTPGVTTKGDPTELGQNLMESMGLPRSTSWSGYQAQHIIPSQLNSHPIIKKIGMDMNHYTNGIFLPEPSEAISSLSRHKGYHKVYNDVARNQLDKLDINQSVEVLEKQVYELQQKLQKAVEKGLPLYKSKVKAMGLSRFYKSGEYKKLEIWNRGGGATEELWERWLNK